MKVGIVFHGDRERRNTAVLSETRLAGIASALTEAGAEPIAAVYNDDFVDEFLEDASKLDGVLAWVNPIVDGRDRTILDATLRRLAESGVMVSTHPDLIFRMGTKQVLYDTREMGWGSDVQVYRSLDELKLRLPASLSKGARVLKQYRGHSGGGIWKIELAEDTGAIDDNTKVRLRHAERGSVETTVPFSQAVATLAEYFQNDGRMIDQAFNDRIADGMIRCYMVVDKVEGFGHQEINALYPAPKGAKPEDAPQPGPRLYYPPDKEEFQSLKKQMEETWLPELLATLQIPREELPLLWDADFMFGPKDAKGNDTFILCEINVSCVTPFPPSAEAPLARATIERIKSNRLAPA